MKRDILCYDCGKKAAKGGRQKEDTIYKSIDGERVTMKLGEAKQTFNCDYCGETIKQYDECFTRSVFKEVPEYYEWESDYIKKQQSFQELLSSI